MASGREFFEVRPMRILVITLSHAVERQEQASRQYKTAGIEFQFVPAISGAAAIASTDCQIDEREFMLSSGRRVTPEAVGRFASHRLIWKMSVGLDEPVLIVEDDFKITDDFTDALSCLVANIDEFGFIRLQSETCATKSKIRKIGRFKLWRYTKAPPGVMCYGLSPAAAGNLARHATVIAAPVDVYMKRFWKHGQRMYGITPYSVRESVLSATPTDEDYEQIDLALGQATGLEMTGLVSRLWRGVF